MSGIAWIVGLASIAQGPPATAADSLTFRDGKVLLGQILDSDRRGPLLVLVRRAWADAHLPDRSVTWQKAEAPLVQRAIAQHRERLAAWRRDRLANPVEGDRILGWIDGEQTRLADPKRGTDSPLMVVRLGRLDVKAVAKRTRALNRMLRLGWLSNLPEVEAMPTADLSQALEGRGFAPGLDEPVSVDGLLPPQPETDAQWLVRRAATEIANDPGGRLLRYQGMVLPEPAPGEAPPAAASLGAALSGLKELLGETPVDPLPGKLRELGQKGRVGAVVTRLELSPDLSAVAVETALWVRAGGDRWTPAIVRSANIRPDDLPANAGDGLADDPQVKAAFGLVESLGLGEVPADLKRRSLNMGAATRKALGLARGALDKELQPLALSLEPAPDRPGKP
jgi:hypothetical protein